MTKVFKFSLGVVLAASALAGAGAARAANYEFMAAPATDLNRVFRLDKATGEVGACQYRPHRRGLHRRHPVLQARRRGGTAGAERIWAGGLAP